MGTSRDHHHRMKAEFGLLLLLALLQTGTGQSCSAPDNVSIDENNEVGAVVVVITNPDGVTLEYLTPEHPFRLEGNTLVATESLDAESIRTYITQIGCGEQRLRISVSVQGVNDNPPTFDKELYTLTVKEMTPVETVVGTIIVTDPDIEDTHIFTLSSTDLFKLKVFGREVDLVVAKLIEYDDFPKVQLTLTAKDSLFSASTKIDIIIEDVDTRPPWFQPCPVTVVQGVKICPNTGYSGVVDLGEKEEGPLSLKPNHIWAFDGDRGLNEPVTYSIVSGSEDAFQIDPVNGNITMLKAVTVEKTIVMTVLASHAKNSFQMATTSLMINVVAKSVHEPQFEKPLYEALVEGVGTMAVDAADKDKLLIVRALDQDYAVDGGINPNIVYTITGSTAFSLFNGYLFMSTEVAEGPYELEVKAEDKKNPGTATTRVSVEVVKAIPVGGFTSVDMAALGASLGVLLFVSIAVIAVLFVKIRKGDVAWKKINEASVFRSALGSSGQKGGVQYTNEAFQHDDKDDKGGPSGGGQQSSSAPSEKSQPRVLPRPPSPIQEEEKEVKPILSKDKHKEDGYKAVWFKEDIDPNAKEDVVIIEGRAEEENEDEEDEEDEEGGMKAPRVKFGDADGDSGLGDKLEESDEKVMTSSL
ncbi:unnamed protein product [Knipowitschia caucasica]